MGKKIPTGPIGPVGIRLLFGYVPLKFKLVCQRDTVDPPRRQVGLQPADLIKAVDVDRLERKAEFLIKADGMGVVVAGHQPNPLAWLAGSQGNDLPEQSGANALVFQKGKQNGYLAICTMQTVEDRANQPFALPSGKPRQLPGIIWIAPRDEQRTAPLFTDICIH